MAAQILDGRALAEDLRLGFRDRVARLTKSGHRPGLAVVLVGENAASQVYVRNKVSACAAVGMHSEEIIYPADVEPREVCARILELNRDDRIHGILVQLPLPRQFDEMAILSAISPHKDVDGFHAENVGALMQGTPRFIPCTPYGIMKLLERNGVVLAGKEVVIVGRSNIVGKPMAMLMLAANATVTVCHSKTSGLATHTRRADILVAAVGKARMITGDMIKAGAVVIDVGINRLPADQGGKLCGDVDFESCKAVASMITPVPGGIGPMTIAMLLANTIEAAERSAGQADRHTAQAQ